MRYILLAVLISSAICADQSKNAVPFLKDVACGAQPQKSAGYAGYTAFLALKLQNPNSSARNIQEQLKLKGFECSTKEVEEFDATSRELADSIEQQKTEAIMQNVKLQITIKETIEQGCAQGQEPEKIHKKLRDYCIENYGQEVMALEDVIAVYKEAQKKYSTWVSHNQLPLNNIAQLIQRSKHPAQLTKHYQKIAKITPDPILQYNELERYEKTLGLQRFSIKHPEDNAQSSYTGELPEKIQELLDKKLHPDKYSQSVLGKNDGILLIGEPGTGKTYTARHVAHKLGAGFIEFNASQFLEGIVGESEKKIEQLFDAAETFVSVYNKPCVVFLDEVDTIARKRNERGMEHIQTSLNRLLSLVEQKTNNKMLLFMAATNSQKNELDSALIRSGRFGIHITFKLPTSKERKSFIVTFLAQHDPQGTYSDADIQKLTNLTSNFSQADLDGFIRAATTTAQYQARSVKMGDLLKEIDRLQKTKHEQKSKKN